MTDNHLSLLNIGQLTKPIEKLIDAVRSASGIIFEPTRIRRKAQADADAEIIRTEGEIKAQEIVYRAKERFENTELRRQHNIENIIKQAIKSLPEVTSEEKIEEDWIYQFLDHCKDISNEQMHLIWGKLLAGETTKPGSFSLRTLRIVKELDIKDAQNFTNICSFVWKLSPDDFLPIIYSYQDKYLANAGIGAGELLHLDAIGLIKYNEPKHANFPIKKIAYFDKTYGLSCSPTYSIDAGVVLLTKVGGELYSIAGAKPNEDYREFVLNMWKKLGVKIVEEQQ